MSNHASLNSYIYEQSCSPTFLPYETIMQLYVHSLWNNHELFISYETSMHVLYSYLMKQSCSSMFISYETIMHYSYLMKKSFIIHILWNNHATLYSYLMSFAYLQINERQSTYMLTIPSLRNTNLYMTVMKTFKNI